LTNGFRNRSISFCNQDYCNDCCNKPDIFFQKNKLASIFPELIKKVTPFSFLTGNSDLHLKNFSLIQRPKIGIAPADDLSPTALINPANNEDVALTLDGKKKNHKIGDYNQGLAALRRN
jgi:Uncharacterized protein related to capsule biosynthesis enzymes